MLRRMFSLSGAGKTVLVTGVNGYIASNIALKLLRRGYLVRGTSRSASAERRLFKGPFRGYESSYIHFLVPDITVQGAFDDAVNGVDAIIHLASPVDFSLTNVEAFMHPAVNGNLSILNSALKAGPQLRAFVLTSSIAAISDVTQPEDYAFSEGDWNKSGERMARRYFLPGVAYGASKTAAERALWAWTKKNKPSFSTSAVNPAVVLGPPVLFPSSPKALNETLQPLWKIFSGEAKTIPPGIGAQSYVHVDDVANLHIWCMEHPLESNGQRYLAANGTGTTQAMADILRQHYSDRDIVVGKPGSNYVEGYRFVPGKRTYISTKAYKALGVEEYGLTGFEQTVLETVRSFEQRWPRRIRNRRH